MNDGFTTFLSFLNRQTVDIRRIFTYLISMAGYLSTLGCVIFYGGATFVLAGTAFPFYFYPLVLLANLCLASSPMKRVFILRISVLFSSSFLTIPLRAGLRTRAGSNALDACFRSIIFVLSTAK